MESEEFRAGRQDTIPKIVVLRVTLNHPTLIWSKIRVVFALIANVKASLISLIFASIFSRAPL